MLELFVAIATEEHVKGHDTPASKILSKGYFSATFVGYDVSPDAGTTEVFPLPIDILAIQLR